MAEIILGISAYFHDSAAALLVDGELIAAAQEERFSRIKNDASFPAQAIRYVMEDAGLKGDEVQTAAFYEKPLLKFERLLETYHAFVPSGLRSFLKAMPLWMKEKIFFRRNITGELEQLGIGNVSILFPEHHLSHAASAFYPSPFEKSAILTIDGAGEWANLTMGMGSGNNVRVLKEQHFPHSLGLLYSAFTYYLGFEVNGGEYKLMGLAAYGDKNAEQTKAFKEKITREIVDIREDGSILLQMKYFRFATHLTMTNDAEWSRLFQMERREPGDPLRQVHANLAFAIQQVLERVIIRLVQTTLALTGSKNLVMAGGVALNSVVNGKLLDLPELNELWVQPAAGDAGGALGAALAAWHIGQDKPRKLPLGGGTQGDRMQGDGTQGDGTQGDRMQQDGMQGALLGPSYTNAHISAASKKHNHLRFQFIEKEADLLDKTVSYLTEGEVVGWFQGRMEFGPRALGNRSILADPRKPDMQQKINQKIKFRESFRPFAPSVMQEDAHRYFNMETESPYMLTVRPVKEDRRTSVPEAFDTPIMERLSQVRSDIPAVTHVDYSARIQTVHKETNPRYWKLLNCFKKKTGYGLLINTSFNVKDEPIVCTPDEAIRCFEKTDMDVLVLNDFVVLKE